MSFAGILTFVMFLADCIVIYLMESLRPAVSPSPYFTEIALETDGSHLSIMSAIDYNQFTFFLLANLCTGLINFLFDTIHSGPFLSFLILTMYLLFLIFVAVKLRFHAVRLL